MIGEFKIDLGGGAAIVATLNDNGIWECPDDSIFARRLNLTDPYPDELHPTMAYDPNPEATAVTRAAQRYGGKVTVLPEVQRLEGRDY